MGFGWAKIGAKVVCINDDPAASRLPSAYLWSGEISIVSGSTYTISSIGIHSITGNIAIKLKEVPDRNWTDEGYHLSRFRPLVSLEDDISMFTALTNMSPIERLDRLKEMMDQ